MSRFYKTLFFLSIIFRVAEGQVRKNYVAVFELPLDVETYVPVTRDNIEEAALKIVYLREWKQASEAVALIHETKEAFDPKNIRIKILKGNDFYIFDTNGVGVSSSGKPVKIDVGQLTVVLSK